MTNPHRKVVVTHGGTDYEIQDNIIVCDVYQVENGVWQATFTATDFYCDLYNNYISYGDIIKIYLDWTGSFSTQVFGGYIEDIQPATGLLALNEKPVKK